MAVLTTNDIYFVNIGTHQSRSLRLYFQVGGFNAIWTNSASSPTEYELPDDFLKELKFKFTYQDDLPVGMPSALTLDLEVDMFSLVDGSSNWSILQNHIFNGFNGTTAKTALGSRTLRYHNRWWIEKSDALGNFGTAATVLFDGLQEVKSDAQELDVKSGSYSFNVTDIIFKTLEFVKISDVISEYNPTGVVGRGTYDKTIDLSDYFYSFGGQDFALTSAQGNNYFRSMTIDSFFKFILESDAVNTYLQVQRRETYTTTSHIDNVQTPITSLELFEPAYFSGVPNNMYETGNPIADVENDVRLITALEKYDVETSSYIHAAGLLSFGEGSLANHYETIKDFLQKCCEFYLTKCHYEFSDVKRSGNPTLIFSRLGEKSDNTSTYTSRTSSFKAIASTEIQETRTARKGFNYVVTADVKSNNVVKYEQETESDEIIEQKLKPNISSESLIVTEGSLNDRSFDTEAVFHNLSSDVVLYERWIYDLADISYLINPSNMYGLYYEYLIASTYQALNKVHGSCNLHFNNSESVSQVSPAALLPDGTNPSTEIQDIRRTVSIQRSTSINKLVADSIIYFFGNPNQIQLDVTLDSTQAFIDDVGSIYYMSDGIDEILKEGSFLSAGLSNRWHLTSMEYDFKTELNNVKFFIR